MKLRKLCSILLLFAMIFSTLVSCGLAEPMVQGVMDLANYAQDAETEDVTLASGAKTSDVRVLSFNIQGNKTNYATRRDAIVSEIVNFDPDFFGLQEDDAAWHDSYGLKSAFEAKGYAMAYTGNTHSPRNAIYYKKNNGFTIVESGSRWLSDDGTNKIASTIDDIPQEMRQAFIDEGYEMDSTDDLKKAINNYATNADRTETASQSALLGSRLMTWALVEDSSGNQFLYVNTHLQHRSTNGYYVPIWGVREIERIKQFGYLVEYINAEYPNVPTIVTGDLNELIGMPSYEFYCEHFEDTAKLAKVYRGTNGTWNNFYDSNNIGGLVAETDTLTRKVGYTSSSLDYCLVTPNDFTVEQFQVGDGVYESGGKYVAASDHKAIVVDLTLGAEVAPMPLQKPGAERSAISYYSGTPDESWYDANNVKTEYVLTTADQLMGFMELRQNSKITFDGITIKLGANMVINQLKTGVTEFNSVNDFATLHKWREMNSSIYFEGVFDGQGHYVSGMYLVSGSGAKGMLGGIGNAEIKNFSLVNSVILTPNATDKNRMGSIAGRIKSGATATFYNIYSDCDMIHTDGYPAFDKVGGILGHVNVASTVTLDYCTYAGKIDVDGNEMGGMIGTVEHASADVIITRCINKGTIVGGDKVGGMVGFISSAKAFALSSSANLGKIDALRCSGGLIGTAHSCPAFFVSNCVIQSDMDFSRIAKGGTSSSPIAVPAGAQVGGLIGRTYNIFGHITNCLISGSMKGAKYMDTDLLDSAEHHAEGGIIGFSSQFADDTVVNKTNTGGADTQLHFNTILTTLDLTDVENNYGGSRDFSIAPADTGFCRLTWSDMYHSSDKKEAANVQNYGFNIVSGARVNATAEVNGQGAGGQKTRTELYLKTWDESAADLTGFWARWKFSEEVGYPVPNTVVLNLLKESKTTDASGAGYTETTDFRTSLNASADATEGEDISWFTGNKTEYTLTTADQLRGFFQLRKVSEKVEDGTDETTGETVYKTVYPNTFEGVTIKLGCDMNVNSAVGVIPSASVFMGTFDGQGHVISGMSIVSNGSGMRSFFGSAAGNATVKNLSIINSSITVNSFGVDTKGTKTGAKAGAAAIFTQIDQKPGGGNATDADVRIENVYSDTDIIFRTASITLNETDGVMNVTKVTTSGESVNAGVGGFVGIAKFGKLTVTNCVSAGDITSNAHDVGGFAGQLRGSVKNATFENCQYIGHMYPLTEMYVGGTNSKYGEDYTYDGKTYKAILWDVSADVHSWSGFVGHQFGAAKVYLTDCTNYASILDLYSRAGGFVGYMSSGSANYLTVTNCVNYGAMMTRNGSVGSLIGEYQSESGSVTVDGYINKGAVTTGTNNAGGVIGSVTSISGTINFNNVINDGDVSGTNNLGGMIGYFSGSATSRNATTVDLAGCVNNGEISGSQNAAGMIGSAVYLSGQNFTLINCVNTGDLFISNQRAAGMIATFYGNQTSLVLSGCQNSGNIDFDRTRTLTDKGLFVGGLLGYIYGSNTTPAEQLALVEVDKCTNTGSVVANRCSAGLIGFIQRCDKVGVYNSSVDVDLMFFIDSGNNYNAGGLIGRLDLTEEKSAYLFNNKVTGTMKVRDEDANNITVYAGGLIGYINSGDVIAKSCTMDMSFVLSGSYVASADMLSIFLGGKKADPTATFTVDGLKYVLHGTAGANGVNRLNGVSASKTTTATPANIQQIGVQYRQNANGTYDFRYIFGVVTLEDTVKALGFDLNVMTAEGGDWSTKNITVYCPTIYTSVTAGNETYSAADLGMSYLFTLNIAGIPAERVNIEEGRAYFKNSVLTLTPFTATSASAHTNAASVYIGKQNLISYDDFDFQKTLPEGYTGEGIIPVYTYPTKGTSAEKVDGCVQINGISNSNEQFVLKNICTNTSADHICSPLCANGTVALKDGANARFHYYVSASDYTTKFGETLERYNAYHTWSFEVDAAGVYDFCFQLRVKNNSTRYAMIQINDQDYDEQTTLVHYVVDNTKIVASTTATDASYYDAYLTGFSAYLEKGINTITIRIPYGNSATSMHFRNIYVKAAS